MSELVAVVRSRVEAECARQREEAKSRLTGWWSPGSTWMMKGSAGAAVGWLEEIATRYPKESDTDLVLRLAERIGRETEQKPGWYSPKHLRGVADMALWIAVDRVRESMGAP